MQVNTERQIFAMLDAPFVASAIDESLFLKGEAHYVPTPPRERASSEPPDLSIGLARYHPAELKSAIQKYVRRRKVAEAMACARAMSTKDRGGLIRRLPIIAAEDCGWLSIPRASYASRHAEFLIREGQGRLADEVLITAVGELAKATKDRDVAALWSAAKWCWKEPVPQLEDDWQDLLIHALIEGDELLAAKIAIQKAGRKVSRTHFWQTLRAVAGLRSIEAVRTVEACHTRLLGGTRGADIGTLVAASILACCRQDDQVVAYIPSWIDAEERSFQLIALDWYCFDFHTIIGKRACQRVADSDHSSGLDSKTIGSLQFYLESLAATSGPWRYYTTAADWEITHQVGISGGLKAAAHLWESLKPMVAKAVEEELERAGKAGRAL